MSHDGAGKIPGLSGILPGAGAGKKYFQVYWAKGIQHMKKFNFICSFIPLGILLAGNGLHGDDRVVNFEPGTAALWNGFMGGARTGHAAERQVIPRQNPVMHKEWSQKIGTGYSGVSLIDNTAITMYSDHEFDYVIALDANDGEKRWQYRIGPTYKGHGNSQDGPLSTPLISAGHVFCLSPFGLFFALSLDSGELKWQFDLEREFKARAPRWGFTSSPLAYKDRVFVLAGGTDGASFILAFDAKKGDLLWQFGEDFAHYRSPVVGKINGADVLLAAGDENLYCVDPDSGELRWTYAVDGGFTDGATPIVVAPNRLLVQTAAHGLQLLEVSRREGEPSVQVLWKNHRLKGSYCSPMVHGDYIYSYSGRFLTCSALQTGEISWKSRNPGEGFIIIVDDHLLALTKRGTLSIAETNPERYREKASLDLFSELAWSSPSFYKGSIYARNYGEVVRVSLSGGGEREAHKERAPTPPDSEFGHWVNRVNAAPEEMRPGLVEDFLLRQKSFPIIENGNYVHFIYRGAADDVALTSDHLGLWDETQMNRIAGTNFFYLSSRLEGDARIKYRYIKNFDISELDPGNGETAREPKNDYSWLRMPDHKRETYSDAGGSIRGTIKSREFFSNTYEGARSFKIYLPPGYGKNSDVYPVAYVHSGKEALEFGHIHFVVDALIEQNRVRPIILVLELESDGDAEKYPKYFVDELIPFIDENYQTIKGPEGRIKMGNGGAGFISLYTALSHPDAIGNVACQSSFYWALDGQKMINQLIDDVGYQPVNIYLNWGKYDIRRRNMDVEGLRERNGRLFAKLAKLGYKISGGELNAGHGWSSWKLQNDDIFEFFMAQK